MIVASLTFTPNVTGQLIVSCTFDAQRTAGTDFGTGVKGRPFVTQDATTSYADGVNPSTTRNSQNITGVFDVVSGSEVVCGLDAFLGEPATVNWWNIKVVAQLVKAA